MLFDFSLDTYKPSVMHTGLLCNEALQTIGEIKRGNIRQPNINHVATELCNCYESDTVAKALIILPPTSFTPTLKNTKSSLQEIQTVLELLSVQLSLKNYRIKNEELLRQEILGGQSISEIRRLARNYVTTLIAIGFNQKYLHDKCLDFFYYGSNRIAGVDAINDFFDLFTKENHKYKVFFRVKKIFENASTAFSPIGLTVTSTTPEEIDLNKYPEFKPKKGETVYAIVNDVEAKDEYSARTKAESILKLSSTLLTIYHHKEIPEWQQECIVFNLDQNNMKKNSKTY
ncbi:hypothetical protein [Geopsychrobacter electrodiphilus]|uniref:hypothetical protein n=1 Tax=Geopsychrobacter electrodiphilus TaxID=225196 RepID=UPI00036B9CF0|nr:hypothetical protein [Geopsychrobacter electrodiphilus]